VIRFVKNGGVFTIYRNGTQIYTGTDASPLTDAGFIALNSNNTTTQWDDFSTTYASTPPWAVFAAAGVGIPPGGTTGQVLKKLSNADYDVGWVT
jgi:hypothetical protein